MKVKVTRDALLYATDRAILFVKKKPVLPVQGMFRFDFRAESLDICVFDGENFARCSASCEITGEIEDGFTVNAEVVHELVKLCQDPEITISFRKRGDGRVVVFK